MMSLQTAARQIIRRMALGDTDLPQQCTIELPDPQDEIRVWLHGAGAPRDVTDAHVPACAAPFLIGIGLDDDPGHNARLSLKFCESHRDRRVLGEIGLASARAIQTSGQTLRLFEARSCRNYCLPWTRLFAHRLYQTYAKFRHRGHPDASRNTDVPIDALGTRSMVVAFICPRPVVLVSVSHGDTANIFPMNLLGSIGNGQIAFALNSSRQAAPLVEQAGRAVFSNIPSAQADVARQLRGNHRKKSVLWDQLPFETSPSPALGIPVPCFATRIRELEVDAVHKLGSHTLFVARVVHDARRSAGPQFTMVHGIYQARRLRRQAGAHRASE
jgi:flavin reductase (DIM6/NTAB) family NADH-FMN oxidoreductase RutF